jgi:hypothetical protein
LKIGSENRTKLIWAVVLGAVAVILVAYELIDLSGSPAAANTAQLGSTIEPAGRPKARRVAGAGKMAHTSAPRLDPTLDLNLLKESEDTKYAGSGRNIFVAHEDVVIPKPVAPGHTDAKVDNTPPPPPPPPPINLKFFGFANKPGEPKKVFLSQGEDVFIAKEGDIVDRRYRLVHIGAQSVEIEDVINNNRQTIPLTQG